MSYFVVDVEADGPAPGLFSMIEIGAVLVEPGLKRTFGRKLKPISDKWNEESLSISGYSREETLSFEEPLLVMSDFSKWILENSKGRPKFISDNLAFDWMFSCYYFHLFLGNNPFGFSGRRIGDLYCGMRMDSFSKWKFLRETKHTHNPVDDAIGNAEVLLKMQKMGLKIDFK